MHFFKPRDVTYGSGGSRGGAGGGGGGGQGGLTAHQRFFFLVSSTDPPFRENRSPIVKEILNYWASRLLKLRSINTIQCMGFTLVVIVIAYTLSPSKTGLKCTVIPCIRPIQSHITLGL